MYLLVRNSHYFITVLRVSSRENLLLGFFIFFKIVTFLGKMHSMYVLKSNVRDVPNQMQWCFGWDGSDSTDKFQQNLHFYTDATVTL